MLPVCCIGVIKHQPTSVSPSFTIIARESILSLRSSWIEYIMRPQSLMVREQHCLYSLGVSSATRLVIVFKMLPWWRWAESNRRLSYIDLQPIYSHLRTAPGPTVWDSVASHASLLFIPLWTSAVLLLSVPKQ